MGRLKSLAMRGAIIGGLAAAAAGQGTELRLYTTTELYNQTWINQVQALVGRDFDFTMGIHVIRSETEPGNTPYERGAELGRRTAVAAEARVAAGTLPTDRLVIWIQNVERTHPYELFTHINDAVPDSVPPISATLRRGTPWMSAGIQTNREWMQGFVDKYRAVQQDRNTPTQIRVPDPVAFTFDAEHTVHPDHVGTYGSLPLDPYDKTTSTRFRLLVQDARWETEPVIGLGGQTMKARWSADRVRYGLPENPLDAINVTLPPNGGNGNGCNGVLTSTQNWGWSAWFSSVYNQIMDAAMDAAYYDVIRDAWNGDVKSLNYATSCDTDGGTARPWNGAAPFQRGMPEEGCGYGGDMWVPITPYETWLVRHWRTSADLLSPVFYPYSSWPVGLGPVGNEDSWATSTAAERTLAWSRYHRIVLESLVESQGGDFGGSPLERARRTMPWISLAAGWNMPIDYTRRQLALLRGKDVQDVLLWFTDCWFHPPAGVGISHWCTEQVPFLHIDETFAQFKQTLREVYDPQLTGYTTLPGTDDLTPGGPNLEHLFFGHGGDDQVTMQSMSGPARMRVQFDNVSGPDITNRQFGFRVTVEASATHAGIVRLYGERCGGEGMQALPYYIEATPTYDRAMSANGRVIVTYEVPDARPFTDATGHIDLVVEYDGPGGAACQVDMVQVTRIEYVARCGADIDNGSGLGLPDGNVDISDLLYFLTQFEAGSKAADIDDGSGTGMPDCGVDIADLLYFLTRFEAGC